MIHSLEKKIKSVLLVSLFSFPSFAANSHGISQEEIEKGGLERKFPAPPRLAFSESGPPLPSASTSLLPPLPAIPGVVPPPCGGVFVPMNFDQLGEIISEKGGFRKDLQQLRQYYRDLISKTDQLTGSFLRLEDTVRELDRKVGRLELRTVKLEEQQASVRSIVVEYQQATAELTDCHHQSHRHLDKQAHLVEELKREIREVKEELRSRTEFLIPPPAISFSREKQTDSLPLAE